MQRILARLPADADIRSANRLTSAGRRFRTSMRTMVVLTSRCLRNSGTSWIPCDRQPGALRHDEGTIGSRPAGRKDVDRGNWGSAALPQGRCRIAASCTRSSRTSPWPRPQTALDRPRPRATLPWPPPDPGPASRRASYGPLRVLPAWRLRLATSRLGRFQPNHGLTRSGRSGTMARQPSGFAEEATCPERS